MLLSSRTPPLRVSARISLPVAIVAGSVVVAALTLLFPSAPTYDPWAWIIWGREIYEGDLNTINGPSWKPLPVLLTTLTAPLGDASAQIWVVAARAGAIATVPLAYLLGRRLAGPAAGVAAAAGLTLMPWWVRHNAMANSEGIMVALVFATVLAHLAGRRGWAFAFGVGAGLLRPEAWPFLGLYALYLLYEDRSRLRWVVPGLLTLPVLWLGPELWGSGNAFRASDRAQDPNPDSPAFAEHPALEVIKDAIDMAPTAAVVGVGVALVLLAARRVGGRMERLTAITLIVLAAAWIGLVAVMTERGFSGNQRYLMVPVALLCVVGAAGAVWLLREALRGRALTAAMTAAAALALSVLFVAPDADGLPGTLDGIEYQVDLVSDLERVVDEAGGASRLKACGTPYTGPFLVPQVAWRLHLHITQVNLDPKPPAVVFHVRTIKRAKHYSPGLRTGGPYEQARAGGWIVTAGCRPEARR